MWRFHSTLARCVVAVVAAGAAALGLAGSEAIHGAGATFAAPLYAAWAGAYLGATGVQITYDPVGSVAGVERIRRHEVDFGATEVPLTPTQLRDDGLVQFPAVIGGVVPVINMRGVGAGELRLSGAVLAEIYLGHIRRWNEAPIAELNPRLALPDANITVVHRTDPSGSTLLFTDYLSRASPVWRTTAGASPLPPWPTGVGGVGNEGVASYVERTHFALGYVQYTYAHRHRLSDVALRNRSGVFVRAGPDSFGAAALAADWKDLRAIGEIATDLPGSGTWPITGASFILVASSAERAERTVKVIQFFDWALDAGEPIERALGYVPVPRSVVEQAWGEIRDPSGRPVWPR
jgi:phosphate transport system substrate-binding protein